MEDCEYQYHRQGIEPFDRCRLRYGTPCPVTSQVNGRCQGYKPREDEDNEPAND